MKKLFIFLTLGILLTSFTLSAPLTGSASANAGMNNQATTTQNTEKQEIENARKDSQIEVQEKNKLKIRDNECQEGCTCTSSSIKCQLQNGKEMTITAGKSGNTIIQVKGEEMKTQVQLYKEENKLYGQFKNNKTKEIKIMPDQIKEKIQERLRLKNCSCEMELDKEGDYQIQTKKEAKFLGFIPIKKKFNIEIDATTGETKQVKSSWWGFLAKDIDEEIIVGVSCGTVTPGQNDACCQTKGYNVWDSEKSECLFE